MVLYAAAQNAFPHHSNSETTLLLLFPNPDAVNSHESFHRDTLC